MRAVFIAMLVTPPVVGLLNAFIVGSDLVRFNREVSELRTWQDMQRFKNVVRWQMLAALVQIVILLFPWPVFIVGLLLGILRQVDVLYILIPSFAILAAGLKYKQVEARTKAIPATPEFEEEKQHVIFTWHRKPFPDW